MYNIDDVPYSADEDNRCARLTEGITPSVGIDGWTQLPSNSYKAAMNAVAKVSYARSLDFFILCTMDHPSLFL